jgi:hypothetical protein
MNDEQLRATYERMLTSARPNADEPTPEQMLDLVEGRGNDTDRLRTLDRVMRSEDTRRDFELLRAAAAAARPPRRFDVRLMAAAAVVVAAVGISTFTWKQRQTVDDNRMRGAQESITPLSPNDSPAVSGPLVFAWRSVPGVTSYEIELVDASGTLVQMTKVRDTTWVPPATLHLVPGTEYRWWVRATLPDGRTLEAPPRRLVLSP